MSKLFFQNIEDMKDDKNAESPERSTVVTDIANSNETVKLSNAKKERIGPDTNLVSRKISKKRPPISAKSTAAKKKKVEKPQKTYPPVTLEKCLEIALKIKELNGGNPWTPKEVSNAINGRGTM